MGQERERECKVNAGFHFEVCFYRKVCSYYGFVRVKRVSVCRRLKIQTRRKGARERKRERERERWKIVSE